MATTVRSFVVAIAIISLFVEAESVAIVCTCLPPGHAPYKTIDCTGQAPIPWLSNLCHRVAYGCRRTVPFADDCAAPPGYTQFLDSGQVSFHSDSNCQEAPSIDVQLSKSTCSDVGPTGWRLSDAGLHRAHINIVFSREVPPDRQAAIRSLLEDFISQSLEGHPVTEPPVEVKFPSSTSSYSIGIDLTSPAPDDIALTIAHSLRTAVTLRGSVLFVEFAATVNDPAQTWGAEVLEDGPIESYGAPPPVPVRLPVPTFFENSTPADFVPVPYPAMLIIPMSPSLPIAPRDQSADGGSNFMVVAAIACVTIAVLVILCAIVGLIWYICTKDRKKIEDHPEPTAEKRKEAVPARLRVGSRRLSVRGGPAPAAAPVMIRATSVFDREEREESVVESEGIPDDDDDDLSPPPTASAPLLAPGGDVAGLSDSIALQFDSPGALPEASNGPSSDNSVPQEANRPISPNQRSPVPISTSGLELAMVTRSGSVNFRRSDSSPGGSASRRGSVIGRGSSGQIPSALRSRRGSVLKPHAAMLALAATGPTGEFDSIAMPGSGRGSRRGSVRKDHAPRAAKASASPMGSTVTQAPRPVSSTPAAPVAATPVGSPTGAAPTGLMAIPPRGNLASATRRNPGPPATATAAPPSGPAPPVGTMRPAPPRAAAPPGAAPPGRAPSTAGAPAAPGAPVRAPPSAPLSVDDDV